MTMYIFFARIAIGELAMTGNRKATERVVAI
nr:MAG TPA: hypothetical protein [Caudoviricetes sp.]